MLLLVCEQAAVFHLTPLRQALPLKLKPSCLDSWIPVSKLWGPSLPTNARVPNIFYRGAEGSDSGPRVCDTNECSLAISPTQ